MVVLAFDTLAYAKKLEQAGMPTEQAEVQAEALKSVVDGQAVALATKEDVERATQALGTQLRVEIQEVHSGLKVDIQAVRSEIQEVRSELKADIQAVRSEIQEVRSELKADIQAVRSEIQEVHSGLKVDIQAVRSEIQEVRSELKGENQEIRADLKVLDTRIRAFEKIGWAVVLGVLALLMKAFLPSLAGG